MMSRIIIFSPRFLHRQCAYVVVEKENSKKKREKMKRAKRLFCTDCMAFCISSVFFVGFFLFFFCVVLLLLSSVSFLSLQAYKFYAIMKMIFKLNIWCIFICIHTTYTWWASCGIEKWEGAGGGGGRWNGFTLNTHSANGKETTNDDNHDIIQNSISTHTDTDKVYF